MEVRAQIIHETVVWLLSVYDQIQVHKAGVVSFKYMRMHDKAIDQTTHGLLSIARRLYLNFKLNAPTTVSRQLEFKFRHQNASKFLRIYCGLA